MKTFLLNVCCVTLVSISMAHAVTASRDNEGKCVLVGSNGHPITVAGANTNAFCNAAGAFDTRALEPIADGIYPGGWRYPGQETKNDGVINADVAVTDCAVNAAGYLACGAVASNCAEEGGGKSMDMAMPAYDEIWSGYDTVDSGCK